MGEPVTGLKIMSASMVSSSGHLVGETYLSVYNNFLHGGKHVMNASWEQ